MKRMVLAFMALTMCFGMAVAQQHDHGKGNKQKDFNPEKHIEMQATRMAQHMALDDAASAKFIKTYKEFQQERMSAFGHKKGERQMPKSDAEIKKQMEERFAMQHKMLDINEKYYKEFSKFLNPKQVARIFNMGHHQGKGHGMHKEHGARKGHHMNHQNCPRRDRKDFKEESPAKAEKVV